MRSHHRPQADIFRTTAVGIILMAALLTTEVQAFSIRCRDMATPGTSLTGVGRIDHFSFNPNRSSLVRDKELPLCVRPSVNFRTEVFPFLERRVSYVAQLFQAERSCSVFDRVSYQFFTCPVEQGHRDGCLMTTHAPEKTPRGFGANGLNSRAFSADAGTAVVFHPSLEKECTAVCRVCSHHQPLDPKVTTNDATFGLGLCDFNFVGQQQIPTLADSLDFGILPSGFRDGWMLQSSRFSKNCDSLFVAKEITPISQRKCNSLVNTQRPPALSFLSLVAGCDLTEQRASQLGWDAKLFSYSSIESTRQPVGIEFLRLKHLFGHPARRSKITDSQSIEMLRLSNFNLDCTNCFQYNHLSRSY